VSKRKHKKSRSSSVQSEPRVIMANELSPGVAQLVKSAQGSPVLTQKAPERSTARDSRTGRGEGGRGKSERGYKGGKSEPVARDREVKWEVKRDEFELPEVEASEWAFDHDSSPDFTYMYGGRLKVWGDGSSIWPASRGVYDPHDMSRGLVPVISLDQPYWIEDSVSFAEVE